MTQLNKASLVSVIMPVFNRAKYLNTALDSILNQDYQNYEIIIIDDGSTEDITVDIKSYLDNPKLKLIKQRNGGPASARNTGIKNASGEIIAFLDADDEWEKEFLSTTVKALISNDCDWVDTSAYRVVIDANEHVVSTSIIHDEAFKQGDDLYALMLKDNFIGSPSKVIIKKSCLDRFGYFREDIWIVEDRELWMRLAKAKCRFMRIHKPLYHYKIRSNSITKAQSHKTVKNMYRLLTEYSADAFKIDSLNKVLYAEKMWNLARFLWYSGKVDYLLLLKCVLKSQLYNLNLSVMFKSMKGIFIN